MNLRSFNPFSLRAFQHQLPFFRRQHPRHGTGPFLTRGHGHGPPGAGTMPVGKSIDTYEITRTLSIEQEFQMTTYTNLGVNPDGPYPPVNGQGPPSVVSLPDLKRLIQKVQALAASAQKEFDKGTLGHDYQNLLEELIVRQFFGKKGEEGLLFSLDISENSFSFDFELDFEGILKTRGQAVYTDLHFELHLDFSEKARHTRYSYPEDKGLRRIGSNIVDTGRYLIGFVNATTLKIFDKATSLATTIWGDPHVDLSDVPGNINGEFSDLTKSSIYTTFRLLDSTEVVIQAPDNGLIESVDIFKGSQHVKGHGLSLELPELSDIKALRRFLGGVPGTFDEVDRNTAHKSTIVEGSDVVVAGGDGNDWYDETGRLVWGDG